MNKRISSSIKLILFISAIYPKLASAEYFKLNNKYIQILENQITFTDNKTNATEFILENIEYPKYLSHLQTIKNFSIAYNNGSEKMFLVGTGKDLKLISGLKNLNYFWQRVKAESNKSCDCYHLEDDDPIFHKFEYALEIEE
jgi:hypothetical protein